MDYLEIEKIPNNDNHNDNYNDNYNDNDNNIDKDNDNDKLALYFLNTCGIVSKNIKDLDGITILRDLLLNDSIYCKLKPDIPKLKTILNSTAFTSVHKNADIAQKWPLINLIRQILRKYNYILIPKRICDGYTKDGKKKYKRLFQIYKDKYSSL